MIVTLMTIDGQGQGNFVNWLKKLGLSDDFLRAYPVAQLVDWGWLRPQFRMVFPGAFFTPPETLTWPPQSPQASTTLEEIWLQEWRFVNEQEPMWFLHPFFRPNSQTHQLLAQNSHACGLPAKPATVQLQDEGVIKPFQDYYFPWQGFALIDVIEAADVFAQAKNLLVTPDVEKRAQSLLNSAKTTSLNPEKVLDAQLGWAVWAEPMTWLAHYTALTEFVGSHENQHGHCPGLRERSAKQLADHLQIGVPQLEAAVKEKLLVLAQRWLPPFSTNSRWKTIAYPYLQKQIYMAVHWLCMLTGKKLDDYLRLWRNTSQQHVDWIELETVLPFEYYANREKFIQLAPYYLNAFNERLPINFRLSGKSFEGAVDAIRSKNPHFNSFLAAFSGLHRDLNSDPELAGKIDFRERQPLDHYLLLAIRAESCLRYALDANSAPNNEDKLETYLRRLAEKIGLDPEVIDCLNKQHLKLTNLRATPTDFIARIEKIGLARNEGYLSQMPLGQAMLCCLVARNYFAHHDYHDSKLLTNKESQFLMGGILLAVLTLLSPL